MAVVKLTVEMLPDMKVTHLYKKVTSRGRKSPATVWR